MAAGRDGLAAVPVAPAMMRKRGQPGTLTSMVSRSSLGEAAGVS